MPPRALSGAATPLVSRPMLHAVERLGPGFRIEALPAPGHWVVAEHPAGVARRILEFAELTPTA